MSQVQFGGTSLRGANPRGISTDEQIAAAAKAMIRAFGGRQIVNLGHGLYPDIEVERVRTFVETVKKFRY